jgi:hypothetical protein
MISNRRRAGATVELIEDSQVEDVAGRRAESAFLSSPDGRNAVLLDRCRDRVLGHGDVLRHRRGETGVVSFRMGITRTGLGGHMQTTGLDDE